MISSISKLIMERQEKVEAVPENSEIRDWAIQLLHLSFPEKKNQYFPSANAIDLEFKKLEIDLISILNRTKSCENCDNEKIAGEFFKKYPEIYQILNLDIASILNGDPAAKSEFEVIRTYPGFLAISFYRIAHRLYQLDVPLIPRILTEYAHSQTGIDIHPGAIIGESFFIDHGTGTVIGESSILGKRVKLYQGVTLGALSVSKNMASTKRHPTIEDDVVIYSGATILGGNTIVGHDSLIGGNVWLTHSVPPYSKVYHVAGLQVTDLQA